jgi:hypothetical protein
MDMKKILLTFAFLAATSFSMQFAHAQSEIETNQNELTSGQPVIDFGGSSEDSSIDAAPAVQPLVTAQPAVKKLKKYAKNNRKGKHYSAKNKYQHASKRTKHSKFQGRKYHGKRTEGYTPPHIMMEAMEQPVSINSVRYAASAPRRAIYFPGQKGEREQRRCYAYWASKGIYFSNLKLGHGAVKHRGNNVN